MALEHDTQVLAKQILEDLKPELVLSSPYSVWDPGKMKFEVAGVTNPQSLAEMQALLVKKAFTVSDMYILRVIRMLGHADLLSISTVLMAEREISWEYTREEGIHIETLENAEPSAEEICIEHENVKMRAEQAKHLPIVLARLSNDEQRLIDALFFHGLGVREYAREIGVPPMKIVRDRDRILAKLKKYFSNF